MDFESFLKHEATFANCADEIGADFERPHMGVNGYILDMPRSQFVGTADDMIELLPLLLRMYSGSNESPDGM